MRSKLYALFLSLNLACGFNSQTSVVEFRSGVGQAYDTTGSSRTNIEWFCTKRASGLSGETKTTYELRPKKLGYNLAVLSEYELSSTLWVSNKQAKSTDRNLEVMITAKNALELVDMCKELLN